MRRKSLVGQVILVLLGTQLLLFASFTCLEMPSATQHNLARYINSSLQSGIAYLPPTTQTQVLTRLPVLRQQVAPVRYSPYVPLAPAAIFIGYALGLPLGLLATALFLILGIIGPYTGILPLAAGGGLEYFRQPTCGYLAGMLLAAWFSGRVTLTTNNSVRQLVAIAGGLLLLHLAGLTYLVGSSLGALLFEGEAAYLKWQPWLAENIRNLTWYALPYDALFSLILVGIGFPFRWLTSVLTSPDIAMQTKPRWDKTLEEQVSI